MQTIATYASEAEKYGRITKEEEQELARRMIDGDKSARERLITANLMLVMKIANQYKDIGVELEDLVSAGNMGLVNGADKYRPGENAKFSTFISYHIKHEMKKLISRMAGGLPMNYSTYSRRKKVRDISSELGEGATIDEIANAYGTSHKNFIVEALRGNTKVSLNEQVKDGEKKTYLDVFEEENAVNPLESIAHDEQIAMMFKCIKKMCGIEQKVLEYRFGLNGGEKLTLREAGDRLGITYERVRQIEEDVLKKLRDELK